jgi:hypothetical protein
MINRDSCRKHEAAYGAALACAFLAALLGCSDKDSPPDSAVPDAAVDAPGAPDTGSSLDEAAVPDTAVDAPGARDTGVFLDGPVDAGRRPDAGACSYDISEIGKFSAPCPTSISDFRASHQSCDGGVFIYDTQCGQREVVSLGWGTHSQTCLYDAGSLVGLVLSSDISSFCNNTAMFIEIGDTAGCPESASSVELCRSKDAGVVDTGVVVEAGASQDVGSVQNAGG